MTAQMHIELAFEVGESFNLTGSVTNLDIDITKLKTYFKSDTDEQVVNKTVAAMKKPLQKTMTQKLKQGIKLPIPEQLIMDINKSDLVMFEHFLLIEADPSTPAKQKSLKNQNVEPSTNKVESQEKPEIIS